MNTVTIVNEAPLQVVVQAAPPMQVEVTTPGVQGPKGSQGIVGVSAYQQAVLLGFSGTEAEWIASLHATGTSRTVRQVSANADISSADRFVRAIAPCTLTLPAATENFECIFKNRSSGEISIVRSGSDVIEGVTQIILTPGQSRGLSGYVGGFDVW